MKLLSMKKSITKLILFGCLLLVSTVAISQAQQGCANQNPNNSVTYDTTWRAQSPSAICGDLAAYIKSTNLTFRVNFHFFRPTNGHPFYNDPAKDLYKNVTIADCQSLISLLNSRLSVLDTPCKTATPPVVNNYSDSLVSQENWK